MKSCKGWAVVTKAGRIKVDTTCVDRESAEFFLLDGDKKAGSKIRRVMVSLVVSPKRYMPPNNWI